MAGEMSLLTREGFMRWTETLFRFGSVATVVFMASWWLLQPRLEPILGVPEQVKGLTRELSLIKAQLGDNDLRSIDFVGNGVTSSHVVYPGSTLTVSYVLRRNISCVSDLVVRLYDLDRTTYSPAEVKTVTVRAPVSGDFALYSFDIRIPENTRPGTYTYHPEITNRDCGAYKSPAVPITNSFEVVNK